MSFCGGWGGRLCEVSLMVTVEVWVGDCVK